ncbi:MAG: DUF1559 domain-containing protein, partial [Isosphaeraceae bacterium]
HSSNGVFPMGGSNNNTQLGRTPPYDDWCNWSAQALMLGYMEQQPLYNAINFFFATSDRGGLTVCNSTVYATMVNSYMCPSDPFVGIKSNNLNSYMACYGTTIHNPDYWPGWTQQGSSGMFAIWMSYGIADCTDGTSNTLAYSEAMVGNGQYNTYYKGNGLMNAGGSMNYYLYDASTFLMIGSSPASNPVLQQLQLCSSQYTPTTVNLGNITPRRGYRWQEGIPGFSMFNVLQVPSDPQYPINYCRTSCTRGCNMDSGFSAPASSWHPGGVNALFADGHVQFVKSSIMRQTWWALGTRGNGEVITANSY